jgi:hypothetical protein
LTKQSDHLIPNGLGEIIIIWFSHETRTTVVGMRINKYTDL